MTIEPHTLPDITGDLITPDRPEWDAERRAWNVTADQRPALVALPADADDVRAVMAYANRTGLAVAPQTTGHNAAPLASLERAILVATRRMRGVELDVAARTARVQAGTQWRDVAEAATPHGLFALSGSSGTVGVAGYTLGGGVGWLSRRHGLAASHVTAIDVVTPDGELVRATPDEHADLFWALRGGGGSFGVVTAIEFRLFPYDAVYGGMFLWPYERHAEVLRAWNAWTRDAPEEISTAFRIMHFPPLPQLPPFLSGRSVVVVDGAFAGPVADGAEATAALRALEPELDTWAAVSPTELSRIHMDPEDPVPALSDALLLGPLDDAALEAFAAAVPPGSPLMIAELRHLGGALAREADGAGVLTRLPGEFLQFGVGMLMGPEAAAPLTAALDAFTGALAGHATGGGYLSFSERPTDPATFYDPEAYARLRSIRAQIDPDGRMLANHPIPA